MTHTDATRKNLKLVYNEIASIHTLQDYEMKIVDEIESIYIYAKVSKSLSGVTSTLNLQFFTSHFLNIIATLCRKFTYSYYVDFCETEKSLRIVIYKGL
jgi:hypothetical protein